MADDLCDDQWWIQEDQGSDKKNSKKRKTDTSKEVDKNLQEQSSKSKKRKTKANKEDLISRKIDENTLWAFFMKESKGRLSEIELEDLQPSGDQFLSFDSHFVSLTDLSGYLQKTIPDWKNDMALLKDKDKGCPVMLIVTASAKRSVDVLRAVQDWKTPQCKTAKLFAKHFKSMAGMGLSLVLEDQQAFLENSIIHLGVGTPNRILRLKSEGFLKFKRLKYVMIDWRFEDAKKRTLVDIPEVKRDFIELLHKEILVRLKQRKLKCIMV